MPFVFYVIIIMGFEKRKDVLEGNRAWTEGIRVIGVMTIKQRTKENAEAEQRWKGECSIKG